MTLLLTLWPAWLLILAPLVTGCSAAYAIDAALRMRELRPAYLAERREANRGDRMGG